jgi:hypothetical protein
MEVTAADQSRYKLSTGPAPVPHIIQDGIDLGHATQAEEIFWQEILRLRARITTLTADPPGTIPGSSPRSPTPPSPTPSRSSPAP